MTRDYLFGEENRGHFWGILETRTYMRYRYALVEALLKIDTYAAVLAAHDHLMEMLYLCRGDNMGVRDTVPALKLRLRRDQECYDFLKWWYTTGQDVSRCVYTVWSNGCFDLYAVNDCGHFRRLVKFL